MIYSIGQGRRSVDELVEVLRRYEVAYLIDVRSVPYSRFRPEFCKDPLDAALGELGIRYVFMGDLLGGRPRDPGCYTDGKVDYALVAQQDFFHRGLGRLERALEQRLVVCLMCGEGEPGRCHRARLVGVALAERGVELLHILPSGEVATQAEVMRQLDGGQGRLF